MSTAWPARRKLTRHSQPLGWRPILTVMRICFSLHISDFRITNCSSYTPRYRRIRRWPCQQDGVSERWPQQTRLTLVSRRPPCCDARYDIHGRAVNAARRAWNTALGRAVAMEPAAKTARYRSARSAIRPAGDTAHLPAAPASSTKAIREAAEIRRSTDGTGPDGVGEGERQRERGAVTTTWQPLRRSTKVDVEKAIRAWRQRTRLTTEIRVSKPLCRPVSQFTAARNQHADFIASVRVLWWIQTLDNYVLRSQVSIILACTRLLDPCTDAEI